MSACVNWIALRLAFLVGSALFVLAMFDALPGIFLVIGFGLYFIAVPFWLHPKERLYPKEELGISTAFPDTPGTAHGRRFPLSIDPTTRGTGAKYAVDYPMLSHQQSACRQVDRSLLWHVPVVAIVAAFVDPNRWRGCLH